jgi:outer membrane protein assembly factor BamB
LFHGQSDGLLVARDAGNGEVLWRFQTGAGADAPVATYEVDGEQYVAILAGGNQYLNTQFGDNLWAFKLGGTVPPLPAPRAPGPPPPPVAVTVSPAVMAAYVGTYQLEQGPMLVVTVENGQLTLQLGANQNKLTLPAVSDTTFFFPPNGATQIEFVKDANGVVTHCIMRQVATGVEMKGARQ